MNKLMEHLYTTKETNNYFKLEYYGYNLVPKHPMIAKLNKIASSIVNSKECEYYTADDITQEVALVIVRETKKLIKAGQITEEYIIERLHEQDKLMATYWSFLEKKVEGHIKDELKKSKYGDMNFSTIEAYGIDEATGEEIIDSFLISNSNIYDDIEDSHNPFIKWFLKNKEAILTKTQLKFLECSGINANNNAPAFRKRIAKRVLNTYYRQYNGTAKEIENMNNINILRELTNNKGIRQIKKYIDEDVVFDIVYSEKTTLEDKVNVSEFIEDYIDHLPFTTLMKLICLFEQKLAELEEKLEKSEDEPSKITKMDRYI